MPVMGMNFSAISITAVMRMRISIFFCFFVMEGASLIQRWAACARKPETGGAKS